ncbi:MAG TPA: hypothetical protein PK453_21050, partial [Leptospiraceae bacterium]|nr:hypothetical protein [Leptospiraceae bacterium]
MANGEWRMANGEWRMANPISYFPKGQGCPHCCHSEGAWAELILFSGTQRLRNLKVFAAMDFFSEECVLLKMH